MRARLAKAENVGSYENPFRVKNVAPARNTLEMRHGRGDLERERVREGERGTAAEIVESAFAESGESRGPRVKRRGGSRGFGTARKQR